MKKAVRMLCVFLSLILICVSFSGCDVIDDMRKEQAFWDEDYTVIYMNEEYKSLPSSKYLNPVYDEFKTISVTDSDVPVLLSFLFGEQFYLSDDGMFIFKGASSSGPDSYYCHTDIYDEVLERIENGFAPESYCYEYYDYNNDDRKSRIFSEEEISAIRSIKETVAATILPDAASLDYEHMISVEECTLDLLFKNYVYDLCIANGKYYLVEHTDDGTLLYAVPEELSQTVAAIMKDYIEAEGFWEDFEEEF